MRMAWRALAIAAAGVVAIGLMGCGSGKEEPANGEPDQPTPVPVRPGTGPAPGGARWQSKKKAPLVQVVAARKAPISKTLEVTGEVVATQTVTLRATVEGPIAFCPWREGDRAKKGERLIEIDRPLYREEVQAAQAALDVAKAKLADLKAGTRPEEIAQARETVKQLEECAGFAKSDLDRIEKMVRSGSLAGEAMEEARVAYVKCQTDLAAARTRLAMLEAGPTKTEVAVQEALAQEAAAGLQVAKATLMECVIRAPFPAVIAQVHVRPGDLATPGDPLVTVFDPTSLVVRFAVPEQASETIRREQPVTVRFDAYAGRALAGQVVRLYPNLAPESRTRTVEAAVAGDAPALMPGLFARVEVVLATVPDATVVPQSAVLVNAKGERVLFVVKDGRAHQRKIVTGIEQASLVQVIEGVNAGEPVAVAGNENLKDGAAVRLPGGPKKGAPAGPAKADGTGETP